MTCREATDFLTEYLAGDLPHPVVEDFEHHLSVCENCRVFLDQFRATVAMGRRAFDQPDVNASAAMPTELVNAILSTMKRGDA